MKILYYDLETTGFSPQQHGITQFAGLLEIDGQLKLELNYRVKPYPEDLISEEALRVTRLTLDDLESHDEPTTVLNWIIERLATFVTGRHDKILLCGFNNVQFDDNFMRAWFQKAGKDKWSFSNLFWQDSLDMRVICAAALARERKDMENFKLRTVCRHLGIPVDDNLAHEAMYDTELVRALSRKVRVSPR